MQRARRTVQYVLALSAIAVLLGIAGSAALGVELYSSQEILDPHVYTAPSSGDVNTVNFNDSQGERIADFNFVVTRPVLNSTSLTVLTVGPSIWHAQGTRLESLRLRLSPTNRSSNCAITMSGPNYYVDGYPPYQANWQYNLNGSVTLSITDFGPQETGTVNFGFGLTAPSSCHSRIAPSLFQMDIELVVHGSSSVFMGVDYLGHSTLALP
jgi:hypothetical protein